MQLYTFPFPSGKQIHPFLYHERKLQHAQFGYRPEIAILCKFSPAANHQRFFSMNICLGKLANELSFSGFSIAEFMAGKTGRLEKKPDSADNLQALSYMDFKQALSGFLRIEMAIAGAIASIAVMAICSNTASAFPSNLSAEVLIKTPVCSSLEFDQEGDVPSYNGQPSLSRQHIKSTKLRQHIKQSMNLMSQTHSRLDKILQASDYHLGSTLQRHGLKSTVGSLSARTCLLQENRLLQEEDGESAGFDYDQLIEEHSDSQQRRQMFTGDAWLGMMRLQKYNDLLDSIEEQEKMCSECTHNRRLLEQVWQTVSNEYFDQYGR